MLRTLLLAALLQAPPATADGWLKLGLTHHLRNDYATAMKAFQQALRLSPSLWTAHLFLGIGRYKTNQFQPALDSLAAADRLAPKFGPGRDEIDFWLGATRIALKQPLAGLKDLERLLARQPNHGDALPLAARTYAELASAVWNDVAERYPDSAPGWDVHGHALESEGNFPAALEAYRQARAINPKRPGPGVSMARLLLREGKKEEAAAALREELNLAPGDAETLALLEQAAR